MNIAIATSDYPAEFDVGTLNGANGFRIDGASSFDQFGGAAHYAGDFNGDGYGDIIISAPGYDGPAGYEGGAYVIFGSASGFSATFDLTTLDGTNGFRIVGSNYEDGIASVVAGGGDINGDGFDDIAIEFDTGDYSGNNAGSVYIIYGTDSSLGASINTASIPGGSGFRIDGTAAGDRAGSGISLDGDINGDGIDDIVIGAFGANGTEGEVNVVFGSNGFGSSFQMSALNGTNGFTLYQTGGLFFENLGQEMTAADFNGDGYDDLVLGSAFGGSAYGVYDGDVFVVYGHAAPFPTDFDLDTLNGTNGFLIRGENADDRLGSAVAAGDVNGDGLDDLILTASFYTADGDNNAGAVYVVFGTNSGTAATFDLSTLNGTNGFRLDGTDVEDRTGQEVAAIGDINGDGFADFVVGSTISTENGDPFGFFGEAYVVFGGPSFSANMDLSALDGTNGFRIPGLATYDALGSSVAGAGDINGDGFDDLMVGATGPNSNRGSAYIIYGREPTMAVSRTGAAGDQTIRGGAFNDTLDGAGGDDRLIGSGGDDQLDGGTGDDNMIGGVGDDIYRVDSAGDVVVEAAGEGSDRVVTTVDFDAGDQEIEIIRAMGPAGVTLTASSLGSTLAGGAGSDTLNGAGGDDVIYGYGGDDAMAGGAGNDIYRVDSAGDTPFEAAGEGTDKVFTSVDFSAGVSEIEVIRAVGSAGLTLTAGNIGTVLIGSSGNDALIGGTGNDRLLGSSGADTLSGGDGRDRFIFSSDDVPGSIANPDHITDFDHQERDRIDLRDINPPAGGFAFIGTNAFSGTAAEVRYEQVGGETHIFGDIDGNGAADFSIVLDAPANLVAADFIL